jgi:Demerecviridae HNH endonuclease
VYDPETGIFRWPNGRVAGSYTNNGYIFIGVYGLRFLAHRLAWLYMTGEWPKEQIDHINRSRSDNRWCNLREASNGQNSANKLCYGQLGAPGVEKHGTKYRARIKINYQRIELGTFNTLAEAAEAYDKASKSYHGEYSFSSNTDRTTGETDIAKS